MANCTTCGKQVTHGSVVCGECANNMRDYAEGITVIADHYGTDAQHIQLTEEVGELLAVLSQYRRGRCDIDAIVDELADVRIMLHQIAYLHSIEDEAVKARMMDKVRRQVGRIETP